MRTRLSGGVAGADPGTPGSPLCRSRGARALNALAITTVPAGAKPRPTTGTASLRVTGSEIKVGPRGAAWSGETLKGEALNPAEGHSWAGRNAGVTARPMWLDGGEAPHDVFPRGGAGGAPRAALDDLRRGRPRRLSRGFAGEHGEGQGAAAVPAGRPSSTALSSARAHRESTGEGAPAAASIFLRRRGFGVSEARTEGPRVGGSIPSLGTRSLRRGRRSRRPLRSCEWARRPLRLFLRRAGASLAG
jgi:hypothetical protein